MENFGFYMPTRLFFGAGSVNRLAKVRLPQGTGLIITGGTSTTRLGYVAKVADTLAEAGHPTVIYSKVQPNPTIEGVRECAALCREQNIAFVVGLGGGSSIDCAKAVGARIAKPRQSLAKMKGILKIHKRLPLLIAIPTTAGTGSETTLASVITDSRTRHK